MKMHAIRTQIEADIEKYKRLLVMAKRTSVSDGDASSDAVALIERSIANLRRMLSGAQNHHGDG